MQIDQKRFVRLILRLAIKYQAVERFQGVSARTLCLGLKSGGQESLVRQEGCDAGKQNLIRRAGYYSVARILPDKHDLGIIRIAFEALAQSRVKLIYSLHYLVNR